MDGNQDNPIQITSSPPSSIPGTPVKTQHEEESPNRAPSDCSSNKSSAEKMQPFKSLSERSSVVTGDLFHDNASTCSSTSSTTTSSAPPLNKRFPVRPGITWRKGEKIEAMDFIQKWYSAKIIDIDEEDIAVLVHFEGWNSRYDQWMDMSSEKIRAKARHSGRKEKRKSANGEYKVGDHVYARWTDCKMYPAKISVIQGEDTYEVTFYDGFKKVVHGMNVKPMPPEIKEKKIEIVHVLPKETRKRSTENEAGPSEVMVASVIPKKEESIKTEEPVKTEPLITSKRQKKRDPEARKKAMARKRKRLFIAGSLFVNRRRPKPKPKKHTVVKTDIPPGQSLPIQTPVASPSIPVISSTPIPAIPSSQNVIQGVTMGTFPLTPLSPVTTLAGEKVRGKKRTSSPAISETSSESQSEDLLARARRRSRSSTAEKDRAAVMYTPPTLGLPPKGFVIEQDHNHFKCMFDRCNKAFRKENLLDSHIKYYHMDNIRPPAPPRKRRKTSSICSTDSDTSLVDIKKRHMSADSILNSLNQQESMDVDVEDTAHMKEEPKEESIMDSKGKHDIESMVMEESIETEDELSRDEVVNCICMLNEENGLMIQCEVCLCWQHAICFDLTEQTLPRKYICFVCIDPPAVRDSCRYIYDQDWLKTGELAQFNFLPNQQRDENNCRTFQATHSLVADVLNINSVLHGVKEKIQAVKDKSHSEYKLWKKNWDEEPPEVTDDHDSVDDNYNNVAMETDQGKCDNIDMFESAAHMNSELNKSSQNENSKIVLQGESNASPDVESKLENDQKDVENLIHDSMDHGAQSEEETGKDSSGESSVNADSESTLSAPEAIAHQNMQDHEAAMAEECSQGEIIDENIERKEIEENLDIEQEDPYINCEKNLLHHILKVQSVLDERLDLIEEQVTALEGADNEDHQSDILSDLPSIKKSLHMLQNDLIKVGRMAAYHR